MHSFPAFTALKICYTQLLKEITGDSADVGFDGYSISVSDDSMRALEKYFDVNIASVHTDDCDFTGVWIIYK